MPVIDEVPRSDKNGTGLGKRVKVIHHQQKPGGELRSAEHLGRTGRKRIHIRKVKVGWLRFVAKNNGSGNRIDGRGSFDEQ